MDAASELQEKSAEVLAWPTNIAVLENLVDRFAAEGNWRAATVILRQIWEATKWREDARDIAIACQNLSVALRNCGDHAAADSMLQQASRAEMDAWINPADFDFSEHHLLLKSSRLTDDEPAEAIKLATSALATSGHGNEYRAARQLAAVLARSGDLEEAANRLARLHAIALAAGDRSVLADLLTELSSLQFAMSHFAVAAKSLGHAIEQLQRQGRFEEQEAAQLRLKECRTLTRLWGADPESN